MMRRAVLAIAVSMLLPACAHKPAPVVQFAKPPEDKLICPDEPARPVGKGDLYIDKDGRERRAVTDEEAGAYMADLRRKGQACRDDVDWLREWFRALK